MLKRWLVRSTNNDDFTFESANAVLDGNIVEAELSTSLINLCRWKKVQNRSEIEIKTNVLRWMQ